MLFLMNIEGKTMIGFFSDRLHQSELIASLMTSLALDWLTLMMTSLDHGSKESGLEISIVLWSMRMMRKSETVRLSRLLQYGQTKMVNNREKL